jgi:hypothetical protein
MRVVEIAHRVKIIEQIAGIAVRLDLKVEHRLNAELVCGIVGGLRFPRARFTGNEERLPNGD